MREEKVNPLLRQDKDPQHITSMYKHTTQSNQRKGKIWDKATIQQKAETEHTNIQPTFNPSEYME